MSVAELRQYRIAGMAIFDWTTSLLGAVVIGYFLLEKRNSWVLWTLWIAVWILFGIFIHFVLGVDTMLGYYLGLNDKPKRNET